ncbi:MAG: helix-turn-helix domain-containing protein [Spirosomataceae bacterium]
MAVRSSIPVLCIDSYPRVVGGRHLVYMSRLEDLIQAMKGTDQPHTHDFYLVVYVEQGSGQHVIDFKTYDIRPNQLFFLSPGQVHNWDLSEDIKGYTIFFEAQFFTAMYPQRLYEYSFFHTLQHSPELLFDRPTDELSHLFEGAFLCYHTEQMPREGMLQAYLFLILEHAQRHYKSEQIGELQGHYRKVRQFEELVNQHFIQDREVRSFAQRMHLSPNYLNAICKTYLNKTASQLIQERVLVEAQRLLTHTSMSIKEISYHLHFKDTSYFSRFFRKMTGYSPLEFKQQVV